jgi:hypothetical protein
VKGAVLAHQKVEHPGLYVRVLPWVLSFTLGKLPYPPQKKVLLNKVLLITLS